MLNPLKYYKLWFAISGLLLVAAIVSLLAFGLNLGIDFKGGTLTELKFRDTVNTEAVKTVLEKQGVSHFQLQLSENNGLIIKTETLEKTKYDEVSKAIRSEVGDFTESRFESIGPVVGQELRKNAFYQLGLVSLGIVLYIAYAFRRVTRPVTSWRFGWSAILALVHDLFVVLGVFSILGHFYGVEIDSMFVTALLTVLGFSVHDTIVVFDRIRENLKVYAGQSIEFIVNHSIAQTVVRSLNTSLTVVFVLMALLLFGGETIRYFVLALLVGIVAGTYSSIFIASPVLVIWHKWKTQS
jgi:preprotein translocase subunit SecF